MCACTHMAVNKSAVTARYPPGPQPDQGLAKRRPDRCSLLGFKASTIPRGQEKASSRAAALVSATAPAGESQEPAIRASRKPYTGGTLYQCLVRGGRWQCGTLAPRLLRLRLCSAMHTVGGIRACGSYGENKCVSLGLKTIHNPFITFENDEFRARCFCLSFY